MEHQTTNRCPGTLSRRAWLRSGLLGLTSLGLADLLHLESQAAEAGYPTRSNKAIVVLWLWGGPSHMETFDLKPDAPSEYRGEFRPIRTNVPGIDISEHLPRLARLADRFALVRSLHHDSPGHVNSTHTVMTGQPGELVEAAPYRPKVPDFWAITGKVLGERRRGAPAFVALPRVRYNGAAYLGGGLDPLTILGDPNADNFQPPSLTIPAVGRPRLRERLSLRERFDRLRSDIDRSGTMDNLDRFHQKAVGILTSEAARDAFDLSKEDVRVRERYGRHAVGQRCLLARRLVEAGVRMVTIDFPCVPGQKAFSWDDHASVWNIFEQMKIRLPVLDQVASAFIDDVHQRGLDNEVLFVVMGEMSHTPKLSNFKGQPGREHWSRSMSVLLAGGGLRMGQAVGSTNPRAEEPRHRPLRPADLLATWYHALGVPLDLHFTDFTGRPMPLLPHGKPIAELV
jgi:hypothetical protein